MKIEKLSKNNLKDAVDLLVDVFDTSPNDDDYPGKWLPLSLEKDKIEEMFRGGEIPYLEYWVAIEEDKVIGVVGLYTRGDLDKKDVCWLGWFCIHPDYRGKGMGKKLLEFAIEKAKKMGKKIMKLYSSEHPIEKIANKMYEKMGFTIKRVKKIKDEKYKMIWRENVLKNRIH